MCRSQQTIGAASEDSGSKATHCILETVRQIYRSCRIAQEGLLWRDTTHAAHSELIMSWKAFDSYR